MKKLFLTFIVLMSTVLLYSQTITLDLPEIYDPPVASQVVVPVQVAAIDATIAALEIYVEFDETVLAPVMEQNIHPNFTGSAWTNNMNYGPGEWFLSWTDGTFMGQTIAPGEALIELVFDYVGGETDLLYGQTAKSIPYPTKGITIMLGGMEVGYNAFTITYETGFVGPSSGGTPGLWTGAVSSDWFLGDNWDDLMVPVGIDVTIPFGTPNDPVIVTNDATPEVAVAANLQMDAATMIVGPLGYLTVTGTLTNNGFLGVISDDTYSGSFIYDGVVGGTFNYWRFVSTGSGETAGWHYIYSPVPGFTTDDLPDYWVNAWDETTSMFENYGFDPVTDPCTPWPTTVMDNLEAWSIKLDGAYPNPACPGSPPGTGTTIEFVGAPNFGDQSGAVTYTGVGMYPGFNLIGNPYPSYWDYDSFFFGPNWPASMFDAIYFWDEDMAQYASYVGGFSTNGGSNFVPPGQGFFLEATANEPLLFTSAEQVHVYNVPFWKDATDLVKLQASANGYTDETVIHFNENSTVNRDKNDARKLKANGNVPTLYTMADGLEISINGMPATDLVHVYFECGEAGTYTIEAIETSEFAYVVLEDVATGIQTDMLTDSYTFNYTADTKEFILHFTPLGTPDLDANSIKIWSNEQNIYVNVPGSTNGDIVVFNMMGQEVISTDIEAGLNVIPVNEVNTYFIVKVLTSDNAVTGKVYIK